MTIWELIRTLPRARQQSASGADRVLLLAPSCGRRGIERYVQTVQSAFDNAGVVSKRLDLTRPGLGGHRALLAKAAATLAATPTPTRLVIAHRALLPLAALLARIRNVGGVSVIGHGTDLWGGRWSPRRGLEEGLMDRPYVRLVAVSSFIAGTLLPRGRATILPPGLSRAWFSVCGNGEPSADLLTHIRSYPWCTLCPGLTDVDLAARYARADIFVLPTGPRSGPRLSGEGFGLVLLEAQVADTAVVGPALGGSPDAHLDGVTGATPRDESAAALAAVLDGQADQPARMADMGRQGAAWARARFAPDQYATLAADRLL